MKKIKGIEHIKERLWESILLNDSGNLRSILTGKPLVYYFGDTFADEFMQVRKDKGVFLQSLRLTNENFDNEIHKDYKSYLKETQHTVPEENFDFSGVFLWDKKVLVFYFRQDMYCEYYENLEIYRKYEKVFNKYWITL